MSANSNQNLKLLQDIVNGYSLYQTKFGNFYFKHLDIFSYEENLDLYYNTCESLKKDGILSEEDQIENAIKDEFWSKEKEGKIESISHAIKRMHETRKKLIYQSDKERIDEQIIEQAKELKKLKDERQKYVFYNVETIANQKATDFYIKNFIYSNNSLSEKFFKNDEQFEYCDPNLVYNISLMYYKFLEKLSMYNIKKLALCTYFQNILIVSTNPQDIFGKSIFKLTKPQTDLLIWGKYFQNIIQNSMEEIPDKLMDDPIKFVEWFHAIQDKNKQKNKQKKSTKKGNNDSSSKFLFGSQDDIRQITGEKNISGNKILQESAQKGGLNMSELMNK